MALKFLNNATFAGDVSLADSKKLILGAGSDLQIYHNNSNDRGYIYNGTGDLYIENDATDGDIKFYSDDGSGGTALYFRIDGGAVETRFLKSTRHFDNVGAYFGDSADLQIYHDGNDSYIKDSGTGDLRIDTSKFRVRSAGGTESMIIATENGSVDLYYNDLKKFETTSAGVTVTGSATFAGDVLVEDNLYLTDAGTVRGKIQLNSSDRDNLDIKATSLGSLMRFYTVDTLALTLDASQNAAFTGTISSGAITALAKGGQFGTTGYYVNSTFKDTADNCGVILGHNDTANGVGVIAGINELAFLTYGSAWTQALLLDSSQNATFASNVTVGHDLKMPTNGEIDWNAGAVKLIGTADDIKLQGGSLSITGDGSNAVTLTESGNGDFTIDAPDDIRLDAGGGDIVLKSAGTEYGRISKLSSDLSITSSATNSDILINPNGNGNVGIGTTSPSVKLEVDGRVKVLGTLDVESDFPRINLTDTNNDSDYSILNANGSFRVYDDSNDIYRLSISSSGNVGIGTTSPSNPLHVYSGDNILATFESTDAISEIRIKDDTKYTRLLTVGGHFKIMPNDGVEMAVFQGETGNTLFNGGNVGIGATSPNAKLTVKGSGLTSQDFFHIEDSGGVRMLEVTSDAAGNANLQVKDTSGTTKSLINSSGNSYFNGGNVGIGTTSPSDKLEIGNLSNYTGLTLKGAGASRPAITFKNVTQSLLGAIYGTEGRDIIIETGGNGTAGTVALTLSSAGALKLNTYTAGTLVSDASGNITVSSGGGAGGPYLPLSAGTSYPLTGVLYVAGTIRNNSGDLEIRNQTASGYATATKLMQQTVNGLETFLTFDGATRAAYFSNQGNVGIGTTSPNQSNLVVSPSAQSADVDGITVVYNPDGATNRVRSQLKIDDFNGVLELTSSADTIATYITAGGDSYFTAGNVGIGTTSPSYKLHVDGQVKIQSTNYEMLYLHQADANGGFIKFTNTDDTDGWYTGIAGTEKFIISRTADNTAPIITLKQNGNVGIGTDSPNQKLQVGGNLHVYDEEGDTDASIFLSTGTSNVTTVKIASNGDSYINGGNVGIATTSPGYKLDVSGDFRVKDGSSAIALNEYSNGATIWLDGSNGDFAGGDYFNISAYGTTDLAFGYAAGTKITMKSDGKLGIGTTSPSGPLHVKGSTDDVVVYIDTNNNAIGDTASIQFNDRAKVGWFDSAVYLGDNGQNKDIKLKVNTADIISLTSNTERMRITSGGNVGIGTSSPSAKLDVQALAAAAFFKSSSNTVPVSVFNTGNTVSTIGFKGSTSTSEYHVRVGANSKDFVAYTNNTEKLRILENGNVGIGTTSPQSKLQVAGGIQMANDTATASADKVGTMRYRTGTEYVEVDGEELITNGGFDTDLTDWTNSSSYPWTSATWTSSGVSLQTSGVAQYKSFYQDIGPITSGKKYKISYSAVKTSGTMRVGIETSPVGSSVGYQKALTSSEVVSEVFTATATDTTCVISFWAQNDSSTNEWVIDNVSLIEVTAEDASYADMCMQTGSSTYEWVNIVRNTY